MWITVITYPSEFSPAVFAKSGCMDNCLAFIDGTVIGIARPNGRICFSALCTMDTSANTRSNFNPLQHLKAYAFIYSDQKLEGGMIRLYMPRRTWTRCFQR